MRDSLYHRVQEASVARVVHPPQPAAPVSATACTLPPNNCDEPSEGPAQAISTKRPTLHLAVPEDFRTGVNHGPGASDPTLLHIATTSCRRRSSMLSSIIVTRQSAHRSSSRSTSTTKPHHNSNNQSHIQSDPPPPSGSFRVALKRSKHAGAQQTNCGPEIVTCSRVHPPQMQHLGGAIGFAWSLSAFPAEAPPLRESQ